MAMYPDQPEIVDLIPKALELDIRKMNDGSMMTDTCDKAHKQNVVFYQWSSKRLL
jgi:hypothetical protein